MKGKARLLIFTAVMVGVVLPGSVLAFIFLHVLFALFATAFVGVAVYGMFYGSRSPRQERRNRLEAEAAQRGDSAYFISPQRPL